MGSFYTNITLKTADTDRVLDALRQAQRAALVSAPEHGYTVVFDEASESQEPEVLKALATRLSRSCACPALAILNHDDDVLLYFLYERGQLADEYNSAPSFFEEDADPGTPPLGGDANRLSTVFNAASRRSDIEGETLEGIDVGTLRRV